MSIVPASRLSPCEMLSLGNNVLPIVLSDRRSRARDYRHPRSARRPRWGWLRRKAVRPPA